MPGILDLPTGKRLPDGELVLTQQLHQSLARSSISFQALPNLGVSFRYTGHGTGGGEAYERVNHDRSFDAHISLLDEGKYLPATIHWSQRLYRHWVVFVRVYCWYKVNWKFFVYGGTGFWSVCW